MRRCRPFRLAKAMPSIPRSSKLSPIIIGASRFAPVDAKVGCSTVVVTGWVVVVVIGGCVAGLCVAAVAKLGSLPGLTVVTTTEYSSALLTP